jgi:hypothetical protein
VDKCTQSQDICQPSEAMGWIIRGIQGSIPGAPQGTQTGCRAHPASYPVGSGGCLATDEATRM